MLIDEIAFMNEQGELIRDIVQINIDNIIDYLLEKGQWNLNDVVSFAPPFKNMWFSGAIKDSGKLSVFWRSLKVEDGWKTNALFFVGKKEISGVRLFVSEDGKLTGYQEFESITDYKQGTTEYFNHELVADFVTFVGMAISFMHCKNVQLIENKIPERLQKARIRKGKLPLIKQYTLEITPVKKILSKEGNIEKNGIKQALHICRGHFKDYRDGRGLFGKYKGLYWWESHVRGSAAEGVVLKDYKVNPPKEVSCK